MKVVVDDAGDVSVFDSVAEAERWIEPEEARSTACVVYDEQGFRLRAVVVRHLLAQRVRLKPAPDAGYCAEELRRTLVRFLAYFGHDGRPDRACRSSGTSVERDFLTFPYLMLRMN